MEISNIHSTTKYIDWNLYIDLEKCIECRWFIELRSQKCVEFIRFTWHVRCVSISLNDGYKKYNAQTPTASNNLMDFNDET